MIIQEEQIDLQTPVGAMRTYVYRPVAEGKYPGVVFFSEIYQQTGPIRRSAMFLAGHGYVVAVPEIFHELNPIGAVLAYDKQGTDKGNADKIAKTLQSYDDDCGEVFSYLTKHSACTGMLGAIGICIGGHLAFRAGMQSGVRASACFYATDIHKRSLAEGMNDNSLDRIPEIGAELLMIWGRQDPHIPTEGRALIYQRLSEVGTQFTWHEFNGQHAFMRDEGHRYDPELSALCWKLVLALFGRQLGEGRGSGTEEASVKGVKDSCC